ncbi:MAG: GHKL domain-containing protein [Clostridia bacterium]
MTALNIAFILTNIVYLFVVEQFYEVILGKNNFNKAIKFIIYFSYYITLSHVIFTINVPISVPLVNIFFLWLISLTYKTSFQMKLITISIIYVSGIIIELVSILVICLAIFGNLDLISLENNDFASISTLILPRLISFILIYIISLCKLRLSENHYLPKLYYLGYAVILFGSLYLFISSISNDISTINQLIINGIILIFINITMITLDEKIYNGIVIKSEKELLLQHNEALRSQMKLINQSTEMIRVLKHDYHNHLCMLSNLHQTKKFDESLLYINNLIDVTQIDSISNHFIIDSILNFKFSQTENKDINLNLDINVPVNLDILDHDLTSVLSNLLDNAIYSCKKTEEKTIDIKISINMDNLIICIKNSYNGEINQKNNNFFTTKPNAENHGFGLTSINNVLKKYDGEMIIEYTNDVFSSFVVIPI